jgi:DNA-binding transcriptional ArsR family regulator
MIEMSENQEFMAELLSFFKALADENRLKIIGLLAAQESTVEGLAENLALGASTVSHHLAKLSKAGLVSARAEGHYYFYSLNSEALQEMARRLLREESLPRLTEDLSGDAFEKKVFDNFLDEEGRIKAMPAQEKKYLVLLKHLSKAFEPGVRYSEKQVNEILLRYNEDTALLRRDLIDYKFMERESGGRSYWLSA